MHWYRTWTEVKDWDMWEIFIYGFLNAALQCKIIGWIVNNGLESSVRKRSWSVSKLSIHFSYLEEHIRARISGLWHPEFKTDISHLGRRSFNHSTATILGEVSNNPVEKYCLFYRALDHVSCHGVSQRKRAFYSVKLPLSGAWHAGCLHV